MAEVRPVISSIAHKDTIKILNNQTINPSSEYSVNLEVPYGKTGVALTVQATYDASATKGIKIEVYWSPDGTNYDTDTDEVYTHPFSAGATKQKTYVIQCVHPYLRIKIVNEDSSYGVTVNAWVTYI